MRRTIPYLEVELDHEQHDQDHEIAVMISRSQIVKFGEVVTFLNKHILPIYVQQDIIYQPPVNGQSS